MQRLRDYPITDFTGGLITNRGVYQMKDNHLTYLFNMELEPGRATKRYGSKLFGTFAVNPDPDEVMAYGASLGNQVFVANQNVAADNGMLYFLQAGYLTSDAVANASTLNVTGAANLVASGKVEIDGLVITYSGNTGTALTGCTGNTLALTAGKAVRQWQAVYAAARDTSSGTWFAYLNSTFVVSHGAQGGYLTIPTFSTVPAPTQRLASGAPKCIRTYKQRVYGLDTSVTNRVDFTGLNDPTSFPSANYFMVEDDLGEPNVNLFPYGGRLTIWKPNACFYYNLTQLQQIEDHPGTYNDETVCKVNGLLYTLCPRGAFATNTSSWKDIGETVNVWLEAFHNKWTVNGGEFSAPQKPRVFRDGNKVVFYLGTLTISDPMYNTSGSSQDFTNVALVYDTIHKYWTVRDGFDVPTGFFSTSDFHENYSSYSLVARLAPTFFFFDQQNTYRANSDFSFAQTSSTVPATGTRTGGYITEDRYGQGSGQVISSNLRTKFYHQNTPGWWKQFKYLRVLAELWPFNIEVRTLTAQGYSQWRSLGQCTGPNQVFKIDLEGYAIQIQTLETSKNDPYVLNGFVLEQTMAMSQNYK